MWTSTCHYCGNTLLLTNFSFWKCHLHNCFQKIQEILFQHLNFCVVLTRLRPLQYCRNANNWDTLGKMLLYLLGETFYLLASSFNQNSRNFHPTVPNRYFISYWYEYVNSQGLRSGEKSELFSRQTVLKLWDFVSKFRSRTTSAAMSSSSAVCRHGRVREAAQRITERKHSVVLNTWTFINAYFTG